MTAASAAAARKAWLASLRYWSSPQYMPGQVPEGLATRRQLRAAGLSAAGLEPAARLHYCVYHYYCPLYRIADARPVRPVTDRQREALAAGRKLAHTRPCPRCDRGRVSVWAESKWCADCRPAAEAEELAAAELRRHAAAEKLARKVADARAAAAAWAAEVLADPATVVLDTETTGLAEDYVVEIAILDVTGRPLLDTLVNPCVPIPEDVVAIHGIRDQDVATAPTFAALWPELRQALDGRRMIIYNRDYDTGILLIEADRLFKATAPVPDADLLRWPFEDAGELVAPDLGAFGRHPAAVQWAGSVRAECAMHRYAEWFGDWSDYWGGWQWQRLNGGHRAAGDCTAVLMLLQKMATGEE
jgi:hypothetical protein